MASILFVLQHRKLVHWRYVVEHCDAHSQNFIVHGRLFLGRLQPLLPFGCVCDCRHCCGASCVDYMRWRARTPTAMIERKFPWERCLCCGSCRERAVCFNHTLPEVCPFPPNHTFSFQQRGCRCFSGDSAEPVVGIAGAAGAVAGPMHCIVNISRCCLLVLLVFVLVSFDGVCRRVNGRCCVRDFVGSFWNNRREFHCRCIHHSSVHAPRRLLLF